MKSCTERKLKGKVRIKIISVLTESILKVHFFGAKC